MTNPDPGEVDTNSDADRSLEKKPDLDPTFEKKTGSDLRKKTPDITLDKQRGPS